MTVTQRREVSSNWAVDAKQLKPGVHVARTLLPEQLHGIRVRLVNTTKEPKMVTAGTCLGIMKPVEVVFERPQTEGGNTEEDQLDGAGTTGSGESCPGGRSESLSKSLSESLSESRCVPGKEPFQAEPHEAAGTCDPVVEPPGSLAHSGTQNEINPVEVLIADLSPELIEFKRKAAIDSLTNHADVFSKGELDISRTHLITHRIDTGTARPIRQGLRTHPVAHPDIIDAHVDAMLQNGVVEPAASPWAANVVLARREDGQYRFCVDYRAVNSVTYKDTYPLPYIDMCLDSLGGAFWFSMQDLRAGYHNVPIHPDDRDKTAFITRRGHF